uniref:Uncharacterized protein n=1 Tax=Rousettus aegyptiacus TaxID=9407 RepID=A0A7J8HS21_ROUAE|nr:hypothetical protein HJG63_010944 [Rousettus aegyptiacus]
MLYENQVLHPAYTQSGDTSLNPEAVEQEGWRRQACGAPLCKSCRWHLQGILGIFISSLEMPDSSPQPDSQVYGKNNDDNQASWFSKTPHICLMSHIPKATVEEREDLGILLFLVSDESKSISRSRRGSPGSANIGPKT